MTQHGGFRLFFFVLHILVATHDVRICMTSVEHMLNKWNYV